MKIGAFWLAALLTVWTFSAAQAGEIGKFFFAFESSKSVAANGELDEMLLDHVAREIIARGLSEVTLHTSCDTAETTCERISRERHNVVALALLGKVGFGKIRFNYRHWKTSALAVETKLNVREPLNRTVRVMASE